MKLGNVITLSRILILLVHISIAHLLSPDLNVLIVLFNYFLDGVDGFVSRKAGSTKYGEFMDISTDRIITLGYFTYHTYHYHLFLLFFLLILIRDIVSDYVFYFNLIKKGNFERHKMTQGIFHFIYSSKISKIINGTLQAVISSWGFTGNVPFALQILFLFVSYFRAFPNFIDLIYRKI